MFSHIESMSNSVILPRTFSISALVLAVEDEVVVPPMLKAEDASGSDYASLLSAGLCKPTAPLLTLEGCGCSSCVLCEAVAVAVLAVGAASGFNCTFSLSSSSLSITAVLLYFFLQLLSSVASILCFFPLSDQVRCLCSTSSLLTSFSSLLQ